MRVGGGRELKCIPELTHFFLLRRGILKQIRIVIQPAITVGLFVYSANFAMATRVAP